MQLPCAVARLGRNFGSASEMLVALQVYGIDPLAGMRDGAGETPMEIVKDMLITHRIPGVYGMLQRMVMCLKAIATAVGMGDMSPIAQLVPHARRFLQSRALPARDLELASAGHEWRAQRVTPESAAVDAAVTTCSELAKDIARGEATRVQGLRAQPTTSWALSSSKPTLS